jgi:phytol kinase
MKIELLRKAIHVTLALSFAYIALFVTKERILVLAGFLFAVFLCIRVLRVYTPFHKVPRVSFGELFFALGVSVSAVLSWPNVVTFQLGMVVLAIADPLAGLVGMRFGKHTYTVYDEKRSFEGSMTCWVVVFVIFLLFGATFFNALVSGLVLMVIEAVSLRGSDNLTLPVVAVLLFQYSI